MKALTSTTWIATPHFREPTMEQQIYMLQQELQTTQARLAEKQTHQREEDIEDIRIAKILKVTLDLQARNKEQKISHRAFTFNRFDGRKHGNVILSWLNQFDDYFAEESFSEKDKIKCATNHLTNKASLWWNVQRNSTSRPTTWKEFQEQVKQAFLPPQFHLQARRAWSTFTWIEGDTVTQYTDRFWQKLLLLRSMEDVPEDTLQTKYEDAIHGGIQAKLHSLKPTSLYEAISYAHDAEKEINSITRMVQANQPRPQPPRFNNQLRGNNNTSRYNSNAYNTPRTRTFAPPPRNFIAPRNTSTPTHQFPPTPPKYHTPHNHSQSTTTARHSHQHTTRTSSSTHGMPSLSPLWSCHRQLPYEPSTK